MRLIRYQRGLDSAAGVLDGDVVHALERDGAGNPHRGTRVCALGEVTLLCPCEPGRVISVGANYADRCRENNLAIPTAPGLNDTFVMPGEAVAVGPEAPISLPPWEGHVEYGAELGIVMARPCHRVQPAEAIAHVLGYACIDNVWAKTRPAVRGALNIRVYDGFCPIGPWIETELDPSDLRLSLRVNGLLRQDSRTSAMLFDVPRIVAHVAAATALDAGDVIMTGTPGGVRTIAAGDVIEVDIEGIGTLRNPVIGDPSARRRPLARLAS